MSPHPGFQSAELADMVALARSAPDGYAEAVLRSKLLSVGLYMLGAGGVDDQTPHEEDEVYYAVRGRARFQVEGREHSVEPGSLLFVRAEAEHRFHDIEEDLRVLVFWAPPHAPQPK